MTEAKSLSFDLTIITSKEYLKALNDDKELSKRMYRECVVTNFKKCYDYAGDLTFEDVEFILQRNQNGRAWYRLFKTDVVFTLETETFSKGLDLNAEEREVIKVQHKIVTERRKVLVKQVDDLAKDFHAAKAKLEGDFFQKVGNSNPLVLVKFITADHLDIHDLIPLRRIVDVDERERQTEIAVMKLKQNLINEYRTTGKVKDFMKYLK